MRVNKRVKVVANVAPLGALFVDDRVSSSQFLSIRSTRVIADALTYSLPVVLWGMSASREMALAVRRPLGSPPSAERSRLSLAIALTLLVGESLGLNLRRIKLVPIVVT